MNDKICYQGIKRQGFVLICFAILIHPNLNGQENFEVLYNDLKAKIEREEAEPRWPDNNQIDAILRWMDIKAADRDNARAISLRANQAGNPYWEQKFINLALDAQNSGELTIWSAVLKLMRGYWQNRRESWSHCVYVCGPNVGQTLYNRAVADGFSTEDIVERARCLMRMATNDLEANWLYNHHESFLGHYDSEGFQVMPEGDWDADCMRRGEFTTTSQGEPIMPADKALEWIQEVRVICEFYHLKAEFDDATDLMVQYIKEKEVLCINPFYPGHEWYIDLAETFELDKAKEYMEGYYATVTGKVEKEKDGVRKPVAGAEVEYEAPKDQRTWTTKTDPEGNFRLEGVILHKSCGPFFLSARGDGCFKSEEIEGPLEEPDKNFTKEKNLLLECGVEGYSGTITITKQWDFTEHHDDYSETYIGTQTITYRGVFKPLPQMEGLEGQPIKMFGAGQRVTGTWKHYEKRYCEGGPGCGECKGLVYEEYGSGSVPKETLQGLIIITNLFPTGEKVVADQLGQFGLENWYDIGTPTENVPTQTRTRSDTRDAGCQWYNSTSSTNLTGSDARFKIKDINHLKGDVSWSSSMGTTGVSITDMTEAIYDQKPFDPEKNGTEYTYRVTWNLRSF
ncbi:MAG: carboxypeptidase-like regulatory domain-containing protein [Bacteroidales bacterium]